LSMQWVQADQAFIFSHWQELERFQHSSQILSGSSNSVSGS